MGVVSGFGGFGDSAAAAALIAASAMKGLSMRWRRCILAGGTLIALSLCGGICLGKVSGETGAFFWSSVTVHILLVSPSARVTSCCTFTRHLPRRRDIPPLSQHISSLIRNMSFLDEHMHIIAAQEASVFCLISAVPNFPISHHREKVRIWKF